MAEHPNCQAIETFLEQFKTPVRIAKTERIDNEKVRDGYTASFMNNATGVGFTAVAWSDDNGNYFKCIIECVGHVGAAARFGKMVGGVIE